MMLMPKWVVFPVALSLVLFGDRAVVNAQALPSFTPEQLNRIARDLTPRNSQDFFKQGQAQIEREIDILTQRLPLPDEQLLKIDPAAPQQDHQSRKSGRGRARSTQSTTLKGPQP